MKTSQLILFLVLSCGSTFANDRPNILIYLADDQFLASVGCYGAEPSHTPNIDRLAREGARFTQCFTPSAICTPNRGVLLSGMYPLKNGAHPNHSGFYDGIKSLPNYMKEIGYRACIVGKDGIQKPSDLYEWEFRIKKSEEHVPGANEHHQDRHRKTRFDEVAKFLSSEDDRPFCLFHAASLPHGPDLNEIPNGLKGYDANNFLMDAELGQYLDLLESQGLNKNTVVIYLNDNEAQNERTKYTLYDTGIHIPMVVRWPGRIKPATDIDPMVSTVDMLPTLIEIAGGDVPQAVDGVSMLGVWDGEVKELHNELFFSYTGVIVNDSGRIEIPFPIRAVRTRDFKYIRYLRNEVGHPKKKDAMFPAEEFFDLRNDPGEQNNLADSPEHQEQKAVWSQKLDAWMVEMNDKGVESELAALKRYPRGKK